MLNSMENKRKVLAINIKDKESLKLLEEEGWTPVAFSDEYELFDVSQLEFLSLEDEIKKIKYQIIN